MEQFLEANGWVMQVLGVSIVGGLAGVFRLIWKIYKELETRNDQLDELLKGQVELDGRLDVIEKQGELRQEASLASLHDRIYAGYEIILKRGTVTLKELNNMGHLWKAYSALGGNGTGKAMYERICSMPVIEKEDE